MIGVIVLAAVAAIAALVLFGYPAVAIGVMLCSIVMVVGEIIRVGGGDSR